MRTLKFKAQPTNEFFATVNQIFGGYSQLPTTAERADCAVKKHKIHFRILSDLKIRSWIFLEKRTLSKQLFSGVLQFKGKLNK